MWINPPLIIREVIIIVIMIMIIPFPLRLDPEV